uniref:Rab-GAP TBC domain-containing protein n=1 Tax=Hanusia phi TaxID=3032 RepID=A0A7S0E3M0_9CRYP|mmetsp:Transcript_16109/g.36820  ORF Transcript_16109/g.36820 Transcript_16109/m.36820 type:complete len:658 (+) Transcript_16109:200-2173(+)
MRQLNLPEELAEKIAGGLGDSSSQSWMKLRDEVFEGSLKNSPMRGVCWRIFLGVLPMDSTDFNSWSAILKGNRVRYQELKEQFLIDPYKDGGQKDPLHDNPLAQAEGSVWKRYFELQELQKSIMIDIERLNVEDEFLKQEEAQQAMLRILTIWSNLHSELSYRQGMHELLAPIVAVLHRDVSACSESLASMDEADDRVAVLKMLMDHTHLEHDAFSLFEALMLTSKSSFEPPQKAPKGQTPKPNKAVARCERVQNVLLRDKDHELFLHLQSLQVEPQLYALRWIRLLLEREFHLEDVLYLWDSMFADQMNKSKDDDIQLLDYICLSMLTYVRSDLLMKDNMGCLQRLMRYPPVEDVKVFVSAARNFREGKSPLVPRPVQQPQPRQADPPPRPPPPSTFFFTESFEGKQRVSSPPLPPPPGDQSKKNAISLINGVVVGAPPPPPIRVQAQVQQARQELARRMEDALSVLRTLSLPEEGGEQLAKALAELTDVQQALADPSRPLDAPSKPLPSASPLPPPPPSIPPPGSDTPALLRLPDRPVASSAPASAVASYEAFEREPAQQPELAREMKSKEQPLAAVQTEEQREQELLNKKKIEETNARRKVALSMLLEPTSPDVRSGEDLVSGFDQGRGGGGLRTKSKGLFDDDGAGRSSLFDD